MEKLKSIAAVIFAIGLTACSDEKLPETKDMATSASQQLHTAVDRHTLSFMKTHPALATRLNISEQRAGGKYNHRFADHSPAAMATLQQTMRQHAQELSQLDLSQFSSEDALHLNIVQRIESHYAGSETFSAGYIDTWAGHLPYIVNQFAGPLFGAPEVMQVEQRVANAEDVQDYLSRLKSFSGFTDNIIEKLKADEKAGVILPLKLYPKTLAYLENFLKPEAKQHTLVTTFAERLNTIEHLPEQQKNRWLDEAATLVDNVVYVGYQQILDFMRSQQSRASNNDGIWSQPGGEQFYKHAIRYLGDSTLDADKIHEIGLSEVTRISTEIDSIFKANGHQQGTVAERMIALNADPTFLYEDSDQGRIQLLADINHQLKQVMTKTPSMFATFPKAEVEVQRIPKVSEASQAGGYYSTPSLDGSRPGIYWINLMDIKANPRFGLKTLTYHEAIPGHHFQIALNMAQQDLGLLRQIAPFNTYTEGWALYAERLANEMGMYKDDPWGDIGRLQAELYRAVRLVVDTGLHAKKWTREQAIDYFYNTTGTTKSDVIIEIERYMALPGQALGYKLGMLQFLQLREWAEGELGDQFDIRAFHDVLLLPGARPMTLVKQDVEHWVKQKKLSVAEK
jgi:uncharacterized protein (DUF885 family)